PLTSGAAIIGSSVSFRYPTRPDVAVLEDVNFRIQANTKVAFVGESGSGKSTIMEGKKRFYDVTNGAIEIDGVNVKEFGHTELSDLIGYVQQEPVLFQCTLRENLLYGIAEERKVLVDKLIHRTYVPFQISCHTFHVFQESKVSDADLITACKQAQIWELIESLPDKLDTLPGQGGSQLSGGQKQRIAIARALVRKPRILLLDEATGRVASVLTKYASEREVQDTVDALVGGGSTNVGGLTVVIVAHRLSTIRNCDKIFFLNRGRILEEGSHEELVALKGGYFKLTETQAMFDMLQAEQGRNNVLELEGVALGDGVGGRDGMGEEAASRGVQQQQQEQQDASKVNNKGGASSGDGTAVTTTTRNKSKESATSGGSGEEDEKMKKAAETTEIPAVVLKSEEEREQDRIAEIGKTYTVPMVRLLKLNTKRELMFYPLGFMFSLIRGSMQPTMMWIMMDAVEHLYLQLLNQNLPHLTADTAEMEKKVNEFALQCVGLAIVLQLVFTVSNGCYGYAGSQSTLSLSGVMYPSSVSTDYLSPNPNHIFKTFLEQDMTFFDEPENSAGRLTALLEKQTGELGYLSYGR
ncbi:unnamed protein product, partial [Amoebophrya sp. A25]